MKLGSLINTSIVCFSPIWDLGDSGEAMKVDQGLFDWQVSLI